MLAPLVDRRFVTDEMQTLVIEARLEIKIAREAYTPIAAPGRAHSRAELPSAAQPLTGAVARSRGQ